MRNEEGLWSTNRFGTERERRTFGVFGVEWTQGGGRVAWTTATVPCATHTSLLLCSLSLPPSFPLSLRTRRSQGHRLQRNVSYQAMSLTSIIAHMHPLVLRICHPSRYTFIPFSISCYITPVHDRRERGKRKALFLFHFLRLIEPNILTDHVFASSLFF